MEASTWTKGVKLTKVKNDNLALTEQTEGPVQYVLEWKEIQSYDNYTKQELMFLTGILHKHGDFSDSRLNHHFFLFIFQNNPFGKGNLLSFQGS